MTPRSLPPALMRTQPLWRTLLLFALALVVLATLGALLTLVLAPAALAVAG